MRTRWMVVAAILFMILQVSAAENSFPVPITKISLASKPRSTDAPNGPLMGRPSCAGNSIYLRYFPVGTVGSSFTGGFAKIDTSGHFTQIRPGRIPNISDPIELFLYSVADDGKIYEILHELQRYPDRPAREVTYLAIFSKEGTYISSHALEVNVAPNFMVVLENGDVLVGGTRFDDEPDSGVRKSAFLGIFAGDGSLKYSIKRPEPKLTDKQIEAGMVDPELHSGTAKLGTDGNVYLLLAGARPRIQVFSPAAKLVREFALESPIGPASAFDMFVAPGRVLAQLVGDGEDGNKRVVWVIYDSQTGAPMRAFEVAGAIGQPACWEQGKRLNLVTANSSTGQFEIASVDIE